LLISMTFVAEIRNGTDWEAILSLMEKV
jgi:hypothetical protein